MTYYVVSVSEEGASFVLGDRYEKVSAALAQKNRKENPDYWKIYRVEVKEL